MIRIKGEEVFIQPDAQVDREAERERLCREAAQAHERKKRRQARLSKSIEDMCWGALFGALFCFVLAALHWLWVYCQAGPQ